MFNFANVLSMRVDILDQDKVIAKITQLSKNRQGGYICLSNVHMCMETYDSYEFRQAVNNADMVLADGRPIFWAQRLLGAHDARQVRGQDLMGRVCLMSSQKTYRVGLYGGSTDEVLAQTVRQLEARFANINIVFTHSPPFREHTKEEDDALVQQINDAEIDVLFVGIGCPKQERWMASHKDSVDCVMLGVGAAFDFIAGSKKHAPRWLQYLGLEWIFRLATEPKRLGVRYLKTNPRFLFHFLQQWLLRKKFTLDLPKIEIEEKEHA